jgi:hypothetical protein
VQQEGGLQQEGTSSRSQSWSRTFTRHASSLHPSCTCMPLDTFCVPSNAWPRERKLHDSLSCSVLQEVPAWSPRTGSGMPGAMYTAVPPICVFHRPSQWPADVARHP